MSRQGDLRDRVALVLGAGSIAAGTGIGRATCLALAREGATVVAGDRDLDAARETAGLVAAEGGSAEAVAVDVLDDEALAAACRQAEERHGRIDLLHCNVGLGKSGPSEATSPREWRRIADANLTSLHVASQAVLPGMRARGAGVILITSSIVAIRDPGYPHLAYGSTKAAAIHFARLLAAENARHGVRVNSIVAGLIDTPRIAITLSAAYDGTSRAEMRARRHAQCPLGRMGSPWDVANAVVFLASDRAAYITATELYVDGGLSNSVRQADPGPAS